MAKTVYLTGAPAAGKSSTAAALLDLIPGLEIWEYGKKLTDRVALRAGLSSQSDLRTRSAQVVRPEDVEELDEELIAHVTKFRETRNILIDSHPVTKETYGFRVTAFSAEQLRRLDPDEIWVLYVTPEEVEKRLGVESGGRPKVTHEEARMHTIMQCSLATNYGVLVGKPVYIFDASEAGTVLAARLAERFH